PANSVFSSAGAAAPPPPGIADIPIIGIAAAADTPSSFSSVLTSWESSRTLIPLMYSTTCCCVTSGIAVLLIGFRLQAPGFGPEARSPKPGADLLFLLLFLFLLLNCRQHIHQIARDGTEHRHDPDHRPIHAAEQPRIPPGP